MTLFEEPALVETEGDTFSKTIGITDSNGDGIDITGWAFYVTVKSNVDDPDTDAVLSQTVTSHDNAASGESSFSFTPTETSGLAGESAGQYFFEIKYEDDTGTVETIIQRRITFNDTLRETL